MDHAGLTTSHAFFAEPGRRASRARNSRALPMAGKMTERVAQRPIGPRAEHLAPGFLATAADRGLVMV